MLVFELWKQESEEAENLCEDVENTEEDDDESSEESEDQTENEQEEARRMSASSLNPEMSSSILQEVMKNDASHGYIHVSIIVSLLSCYMLITF